MILPLAYALIVYAGQKAKLSFKKTMYTWTKYAIPVASARRYCYLMMQITIVGVVRSM
jgi:hypothetical protein